MIDHVIVPFEKNRKDQSVNNHFCKHMHACGRVVPTHLPKKIDTHTCFATGQKTLYPYKKTFRISELENKNVTSFYQCVIKNHF